MGKILLSRSLLVSSDSMDVDSWLCRVGDSDGVPPDIENGSVKPDNESEVVETEPVA